MDFNNQKNEKELSLIDIWQIIYGHILFIISITLLFFTASIIYAWFIVTPDYISNADVMVQVEQDNISQNDSNFDLVNAFRLIDTVAELMEKEVILVNAINRLENLGYENFDAKYLRNGLIITSSSSSYFINISYVDEDLLFAQAAVDAIIDAVIEETDIADAFPVLTNKIRRTSFATESEYNSPNKVLFAVLGFGLGLGVSVGFVVIKEFLSTKFRGKEDVENFTGVPVLGVIPLMNSKEARNGKK